MHKQPFFAVLGDFFCSKNCMRYFFYSQIGFAPVWFSLFICFFCAVIIQKRNVKSYLYY